MSFANRLIENFFVPTVDFPNPLFSKMITLYLAEISFSNKSEFQMSIVAPVPVIKKIDLPSGLPIGLYAMLISPTVTF